MVETGVMVVDVISYNDALKNPGKNRGFSNGSARTRGVWITGSCMMVADFHCRRTGDEISDKFRMSANGAVKNGALIFRNQEEI